MSISRKIAHKAEAVKGAFTEKAGRLTGSRRLRAKGRADQAKGNLKQAGAKVNDALEPNTCRAGSPHSRPPRGRDPGRPPPDLTVATTPDAGTRAASPPRPTGPAPRGSPPRRGGV